MQNHQQNPQPLKSQSLLQQNSFSSILENNSTRKEQEIQKILEDFDREFSHLLNDEIIVERSFIDWGFEKVKGATWDSWLKSADEFLDKKSSQAYDATLRSFHNSYRHMMAAVVRSDKAKAKSQAVKMARTNYENFTTAIGNVEKINREIAALVVKIGNLKGDEKLFIARDSKKFVQSVKSMRTRTSNQDIKDACDLILAKVKPRENELSKAYVASKWMASQMYRPLRRSTREIEAMLQRVQGFGVYDAPVQKPQDEEDPNKKKDEKSKLIHTNNYESNYPQDPKKFDDVTVSNMYTYVEREARLGRLPEFQVKRWERELRTRQAKVKNDSVEVNQYDFENLLNEFAGDWLRKKFDQFYSKKEADKKKDENSTVDEKNENLYKQIKASGKKVSSASNKLISGNSSTVNISLSGAVVSRPEKKGTSSIKENLESLQQYEKNNCRRSNKDIYEHFLKSLVTIQGNMDHNIEISDQQHDSDTILPYKIALVHELNLQYHVFLTHVSETFSQIASNIEQFAKNEKRKDIIGNIKSYSISANSPFSDFIQQFSKNYSDELLHTSSGLHTSEGFHQLFLEITKINGAREFHQTRKMMKMNLSHDDVYKKHDKSTQGYKKLLLFLHKHEEKILSGGNPTLNIRKELENNEEFRQTFEELLSTVSVNRFEPTDRHKEDLEKQHDNAGYAKESLERLSGDPKEVFLKNPKLYGHEDVERVCDELKKIQDSIPSQPFKKGGFDDWKEDTIGFYYDNQKNQFEAQVTPKILSNDGAPEDQNMNDSVSSLKNLWDEHEKIKKKITDYESNADDKYGEFDSTKLQFMLKNNEYVSNMQIMDLAEKIKTNENLGSVYTRETKEIDISEDLQEVLLKIYKFAFTKGEQKSLIGKNNVFDLGNSTNKKIVYKDKGSLTGYSSLLDIPLFDSPKVEDKETKTNESFFEINLKKFILEDDKKEPDIEKISKKLPSFAEVYKRAMERVKAKKKNQNPENFIEPKFEKNEHKVFVNTELRNIKSQFQKEFFTKIFIASKILDKFVKMASVRKKEQEVLKGNFLVYIFRQKYFMKKFLECAKYFEISNELFSDKETMTTERFGYEIYSRRYDSVVEVLDVIRVLTKKLSQTQDYTEIAGLPDDETGEPETLYLNPNSLNRKENAIYSQTFIHKLLFLLKGAGETLQNDFVDLSDGEKEANSEIKKYYENLERKFEKEVGSENLKKAIETIRKFRAERMDIHQKPNLEFFVARIDNLYRIWKERADQTNPEKARYTNTKLDTILKTHKKGIRSLKRPASDEDKERIQRDFYTQYEHNGETFYGDEIDPNKYFETIFIKHFKAIDSDPKLFSESSIFIKKIISEDSEVSQENEFKQEEEFVIEFLNNISPSHSFTHDVVNNHRMNNEILKKYHVDIGLYMRNNKVSFRISLMKKAIDEKETDVKDDSHLEDFYEKEAEVSTRFHKNFENRQDEKERLGDEDIDDKIRLSQNGTPEKESKKLLYKKSFDDVEKSHPDLASRYGKDIWRSVERVVETSYVFRSLKEEQKITAHYLLLDINKALSTETSLNQIQQYKFSKQFMDENELFFQTKTKYQTKDPKPLNGMYGNTWAFLSDVELNTKHNELPEEIRNKIDKDYYTSATYAAKNTGKPKRLSPNQQKTFHHLLITIGMTLQSTDTKDVTGIKAHRVMLDFSRRASRYMRKLLKEDTDYLKDERQLLKEAVASIRWRRNPRTHLNKVVMTCKTGQYKKSLNKDIKVAGQKVKEVMCLPVTSKPASQKAKDRKSSIKRWRKIKSNPGKMTRSKLKRSLTKKYSKSLR